MFKTKNYIFIGLYVIAWLIFVGLSIEAGGIIVNFIFSIFKPEFVSKLYQKLDLSELYQQSYLVFFGIYGFIITIAVLKAQLFYYVVMLMGKIDLSKPFNTFAAKQISNISYIALSIGIISHIARQVAKYLQYHTATTANLGRFWEDSQAFILMAAVIYIIATIFKKGVEIQTENELTV